MGSGRLYHISRSSTGAEVDCVVSVRQDWNLSNGGLCHISKTGAGIIVECVVSVGLVMG